MLSEERHAATPPTRSNSAVTDQERQSRMSSSSETEKGSIPPAPPFSSMSRQTTRDTSPTPSEASDATTPTTARPVPLASTSSYRANNQRTPLRGSSSLEENDRSRIQQQSSVRTGIKQMISGGLSKFGARDSGKSKYTTISNLVSTGPTTRGKTNESVFEKVDIHSGHTSYLGTGNYSKLEDCIRNCLDQNRHPRDPSYSSSRSLTRASILEDYSYDGIIAPRHHHSHYYDRSDHYHDYSHHDHHPHRKSAADLSLSEIRQLNDELSKYGISVFSHHDPYNHHHQKPHSVGELLSACKLLNEDPNFAAYRQGNNAVNHVWDHLHHYQTPPTNPSGYGQSAVNSVASHLFNTSYPTSYNRPSPPQPQPPPATQFFSAPPPPPAQPSFMPSYQPNYNAYNQAPPPSNTGRSVLASLFSGRS